MTTREPASVQRPTPAQEQLFRNLLAMRSAGRWAEGEAVALQLLDEMPKAIPVALLGAEMALRLDHYQTARRMILRVALPPIGSAEFLLQLLRWLRRFEESERIEHLFAESEWQKMGPPALLAELALHLGSSGLYPLAEACTAHALAQAPGDANLHYLSGMHAMFAGERGGSLKALKRALQLRPGMPNAHMLVAMQGDPEEATRQAATIRRALELARSPEEVAYLSYALHLHLDALGDYDEAWAALVRGHVARLSLSPYRREQQHALFAALQGVEPSRTTRPRDEGDTGLIFIVGMFRSGTSLVERVLAGHPEVVDGGETMQFAACMRDAVDHDTLDVIDQVVVERAREIDFEAVRGRMQGYANWRSGGKKWLTEKLPSNFLNLGYILQAIPDAKVIHMHRDPVATCFSNLRTFFSGSAPYACDQGDMADYYLRYQELMEHWHGCFPGRIFDAEYSAFVADPDGQSHRLLEFCGLEFNARTLELERSGGTSATASAAHVRKGVLSGRDQAWKNYEGHLGRLIEGLRPVYARAGRD